ncbi:DMT family transporter [Streptomyces sp. NPDC001262]|uniref:DMT family transporter n=1 Tax=Streptomyces sp. NPDC001262 TaxID=3364552 RepID=UPI0036CC44DF
MNVVTRQRGGILPLTIASVLWGVWTTAEKYSLSGLPVMTVLGVSLAAATALLWAALLNKGHQRPDRAQLRLLAVLGLLEPMLGYAAISMGLVHIEATQGALLSGTESCFVVALAAIVGRRLPTVRGITGVLLATAGVALLSGAHATLGLTPGDLMVLLGSLAAATATIVAGRAVLDLDPLVVTAYQFAFGFLFTLPLLVWQWAAGSGGATAGAEPGHWIVVVFVCGGGLAAAFLLFNHAITRVSVSAAGVVLNIIPLFGLLAATLLLGESVNRWQCFGAMLILGGIFLFTDSDVEGG